MENLTSVIKLAIKIRNGANRTAYIKRQSEKADWFLQTKGLTEMEVEYEPRCFFNLSDVFTSVINGEV